ncbi:hypothetical protein ASPZODRAFT_142513 [Penicilliopsis zonata CBS 506.65]|uniref:RING-type domain-containing protein n=1 Tax=Penicilliopsis zonata CBS 506.65 TaxID=1073090 RepID=A0A1L9SI50_9EURO|nr:hypothetical protein ASPZODRAFT_142513 [Penicilliopsis zonata CBS 506.65]OJJ46714.1 hypothetical protein ASPZODRAFT_142513 [Penicilliopsis zonata CBS 506.65]
MGQTSSTQRETRRRSLSDFRRFSQIGRDRGPRHEEMNNGQIPEQSESSFPSGTGSNGHEGPSFHGDPAPQHSSSPSGNDLAAWEQMRSIPENDSQNARNEQQAYRSATLARMAARRQSTMSRLGSRILPNSVIRGLLNSEEETPAEGQAHRHGIVSRTLPRSETAHGSSRFSPFSSLGSRGIARRRSLRTPPYFIPHPDASLNSDALPNPSYLHTSERSAESSHGVSWRRSARLHRVRNSLSNPISQIFGQPPSTITEPDAGTSRHQAVNISNNDSPNILLPLPRAMDTRLDFSEPPHELDSVEPAIPNTRSISPVPSGQSSPGMMGVRRLPSLLRARSSRAARREEHTPLSRVLQLAAAAIAAQLSGVNGPVLPNIQSLGNDGLDGSLENFIQSLQHATSAQANAAPPGDSANPQGDGPAPPVNFLRVFRFSNSDTFGGGAPPAPGRQSAGTNETSRQSDQMEVDDAQQGGSEGRTVTLVVVGVRSVPASNAAGSEPPANAGTGLDALLGLPFSNPATRPRNPADGNIALPRMDGRPRFAPSRPSAGGNGVLAGGGPDSSHRAQGHVPPLSSRRLSDAGSQGGLPSSLPTAMSESPPGPHPPPSTPAEPGISAVSSGTSTPSRRPSSASAFSPNILPELLEDESTQPRDELAEDQMTPSINHQRRRSDSEYARHRDLGSGSVRRNGLVEPDNATPTAGRSWLIYVVGTNLSENHPAFATPSLFTDNPTYEDMILLSSLLGPAKPPVASQADVSSAGGLFRLVEYAGSLVAEPIDGVGGFQVPDGDRCLICLSDYEAAEELRQLTRCQHIYHKDCIDQWLTTGRNSCPLCRGQGVTESSTSNPVQDTAV